MNLFSAFWVKYCTEYFSHACFISINALAVNTDDNGPAFQMSFKKTQPKESCAEYIFIKLYFI